MSEAALRRTVGKKIKQLLELVSGLQATAGAASRAAGNNANVLDPGQAPAAAITFNASLTPRVSGRIRAIAEWQTQALAGSAVVGDTLTFTFTDGTTTLTQTVDVEGAVTKGGLCSFVFDTPVTTPFTLGVAKTYTLTCACNNAHTIGSSATHGSIALQELPA